MNEEQKKIVSDEIRVQRFKSKLTQIDMATALNITRETYRKLENDPSKISFEQGLIISYRLNWNLFNFIMDTVLHNAI